jgi:hypothetical protein
VKPAILKELVNRNILKIVAKRMKTYFAQTDINLIRSSLTGNEFLGLYRLSTYGFDFVVRYYEQEKILAIIFFATKQEIHGTDFAFKKGVSEFLLKYSAKSNPSFSPTDFIDYPKDNAMRVNNSGGIDLTPVNMNLQTKVVDSRFRGNDSEGIKFHLDPAMLKQLQDAPGFVPVIINIQPMTDLPMFLGLKKNNPSTVS